MSKETEITYTEFKVSVTDKTKRDGIPSYSSLSSVCGLFRHHCGGHLELLVEGLNQEYRVYRAIHYGFESTSPKAAKEWLKEYFVNEGYKVKVFSLDKLLKKV